MLFLRGGKYYREVADVNSKRQVDQIVTVYESFEDDSDEDEWIRISSFEIVEVHKRSIDEIDRAMADVMARIKKLSESEIIDMAVLADMEALGRQSQNLWEEKWFLLPK